MTEAWATTDPGNDASVRLLRRTGFAQVDEVHPDVGSYDEGDLVFRRRRSGGRTADGPRNLRRSTGERSVVTGAPLRAGLPTGRTPSWSGRRSPDCLPTP